MKASWSELTEHIEKATRQRFTLVKAHAMHGGDINRVYRLQGVERNYFVKINSASLVAMFEVEALGLQALIDTKTLRIPEPVTFGRVGKHAFLVLEYVPLKSLTPATMEQLGQQLAQMHQQEQSYFGWYQDNYIGSNEQKNTPDNNWVSFWQGQRLSVQLKLAANNGYAGKVLQRGEYLCQHLATFFESYQPQASLLHGDLWSGNAAVDDQGQAIIYDPACYYGDREADIAMTELFGGFSASFYAAYEEVWSLDAGYKVRKALYNLYHILNHLNLFGSSYLRQAEVMIERLIAEIE